MAFQDGGTTTIRARSARGINLFVLATIFIFRDSMKKLTNPLVGDVDRQTLILYSSPLAGLEVSYPQHVPTEKKR